MTRNRCCTDVSRTTDKIDVPADEVVPLDAIATGVVGLRILFVNLSAVQGPVGWTLIDGGLGGTANRIEQWAKTHFGKTAPNAIVLTHAHFDHVGAIEELTRTCQIPVYAHREEMPYVTGERSYPPPDPSVGGCLVKLGLTGRMRSQRKHEQSGTADLSAAAGRRAGPAESACTGYAEKVGRLVGGAPARPMAPVRRLSVSACGRARSGPRVE
jgi:metallo-beta-lactamase superfamily protein